MLLTCAPISELPSNISTIESWLGLYTRYGTTGPGNKYSHLYVNSIEPSAAEKGTVYPRRLDPFYIMAYYSKSVKTSWTYGTHNSSSGIAYRLTIVIL